MKPRSLKDRTLAAVGWNAAAHSYELLIGLVVTVTLARLLSPREFGLAGMIFIVTQFGKLFSDLGFGAALIQKRNLEASQITAVFWINVLAGILLGVSFYLAAPLVALFYKEPSLLPMMKLAAAGFTVRSFTIVQRALLRRSLGFKYLARVDTISATIAGALAIALAAGGYGAWSLIWQALAAGIADVALLWQVGDWRPTFRVRLSAVRGLLSFSTNHFGTQVLGYWVRNMDYILIGRVLGPSSLGAYAKAYNLMLVPVRRISRMLSNVLFPALSEIQDDPERVGRIYLRTTRIIGFVTFPLMLGLMVLARPFVHVVFGPQWTETVPILQVLSVLGIIQSIGTLNGNLYLSQGRADLALRVGFAAKIVLITGMVIGLRAGALGVAMGYTAAAISVSYWNFYFAGRLIGLKYTQVSRNLLPVMACALSMALVVLASGQLLTGNVPVTVELIIRVLLGVAVYWALAHGFRIDAYTELLNLVGDKLGGRFRAATGRARTDGTTVGRI